MAISTQLVASLAAGGGNITAVKVPSLGLWGGTYTWGESGKTYLVMDSNGFPITTSGNVDRNNNGVSSRVIRGPITFSGSDKTFLCIEVATN